MTERFLLASPASKVKETTLEHKGRHIPSISFRYKGATLLSVTIQTFRSETPMDASFCARCAYESSRHMSYIFLFSYLISIVFK